MPTTITISQLPNTPFDMAYGPNPITLTGITTNEDKYVLRIFDGGATPLADVRQTPNKFGKAIFDLQNILQSRVAPPAYDIDSLGVGPGNANSIRNSVLESVAYTLSVGYEMNGEVTMAPTGYGTYIAYGGSKQYYQVPFDAYTYQSQVTTSVDNCPQVNRVGLALTDTKWLTGPADTGDDIQDYLTINQNIATRNVYADDLTTTSWFQYIDRQGTVDNKIRGIEAWKYYFCTDDIVQGLPVIIPNTTTYSGGPNASIGDGFGIPNTLKVVTLATGPGNLPGTTSIPAGTTHYYVVPTCYSGALCSTTVNNLDDQDLMQVQRFNILEEKCNDFEHFQFSWLNSLGFKDYFTFTKRVDNSTTTKRNNFLMEAADYNGTSYSVAEGQRGYTTYSSKIEDIYTVTSSFMNNDQAKLLQTLFQSPDVRVRMSEDAPLVWRPINILSSTYDQKTNRKDKLFQYTIRFKIAHNIKAQRG
tara:strand:+ start:1868 stop:3286 length:1419 start_codon:yes stop_codon:yes gene_type:complete